MDGVSFPVSYEVKDKDFVILIGKAKVEREGTDVTIVTFSKIVVLALEASELLASYGIFV